MSQVQPPAQPSLQVRYSPVAPTLNVTLVRATDFKGRTVPLAAAPVTAPTSSAAGERSILFPIQTYRDSRVLNATFAVHRSRFVELDFGKMGTPARSVPMQTRGVEVGLARP